MGDIRELTNQLSAFFRTTDFFVSTVQGGASTRQYYRIDFRKPAYFPTSTVMLMVIPPTERRILNDYINIDCYFKRKTVSTPRVFEVNLDHCWIFQHFEESPTLESYLHVHPEELERIIPHTVNFIQQMLKNCPVENHCPAFQRRFDFDKYMFEFNFHVAEQLLTNYFQFDFDQTVFRTFAEEICTTLDIDLPVFTHRDFQSSNVFITNWGKKPMFSLIDFQDARYGSPTYDVVSCLWDSYLPIPQTLREKLIREHFTFLQKLGINWDWESYEKNVDYTIIQRKLHDAGAFAYNYRRFKSKRYVGYINSTLEMVLQVLKKYPDFAGAKDLFEKARLSRSPG